MRPGLIKRWIAAALVSVSTAWLPVQAAVPTHWKDTGFSINASGMSLRDVLIEFGKVYGVRVTFETNADTILRGQLKGDTGIQFLDRLTQTYKFRWFVYNETLYVVPRDDTISLRLEVGEDAVQDAKLALTGVGLYDSRFGWGELPDEGVVIVSGPRAYVNLARSLLLPEGRKAASKGKQIMVFRLKYASASDRVISTRGQSETIPGVKTILSNLLFGGNNRQITDPGSRFDVGSSKRSRTEKTGRGDAREVGSSANPASRQFLQHEEEESEVQADAPHKSRATAKNDKPRIEADTSLNAIMIYDHVSRREVYKELIAELDVEPQQVEIEALIVDIDRSKLSEMGVEWGVRSGDTVSRINGTGADSKGIELPLPGATLLISNAARFYARLKALEGTGQAHVLAKPTVLTLNNVAAILDLSQTSYVPLVGERVADLANVTAGTMLRVVPRIVQEGALTKVRLEVDIEDGAINDPSLKSGVTRSTISTQAIIDLQQTLMIGGYHAESVSSNLQKVPLLGDVPLVGNLFRNGSNNYSNRERLFLITPRLSGSTGVLASQQSRAKTSAERVAKEEYPMSVYHPPAPPQPPAQLQANVHADAQGWPQPSVQPAAQPAVQPPAQIPVAPQPKEQAGAQPPHSVKGPSHSSATPVTATGNDGAGRAEAAAKAYAVSYTPIRIEPQTADPMLQQPVAGIADKVQPASAEPSPTKAKRKCARPAGPYWMPPSKVD